MRHGLADEVRLYLAAVDTFRSEGISIDWRLEPSIGAHADTPGRPGTTDSS